ncbi:MAG: hypothetical protein ACJ79L_14670 [Anaeromyxobacteraceae bacterium]
MRTTRALPLVLSLAGLLTGCGGAGTPADASGGAPVGAPAGGAVPPVATPTCDGARLSAPFLGKDRLLVGLSTGSEASAAAAPYDLRYEYIAAGISPGPALCTSCDGSCATWWGCWQDPAKPLGLFARDLVANAKAASPAQVPMFTYYQLLQSMAPPSEGDAEVTQVRDAAFMRRYLADYRFLLQQIGGDVAVLHLEPDFWGYAGRRQQACSAIPAAVASANPTDCAGQPETLAGLGRCMIAMARRYAPNAKVGLHASSWGYQYDALENAAASFDVAAEARRVGTFLAGCGAADGDFIAADMSDRDAGTNGKWWDATNAALPNFHQAFTWGAAVAAAVGRPLLWWQVPVGNTTKGLPASQQDNRVDYLLTHPEEIAAGGAVGVAFGAGASGEATPEADGGNLAARTRAYAAGASAPVCR